MAVMVARAMTMAAELISGAVPSVCLPHRLLQRGSLGGDDSSSSRLPHPAPSSLSPSIYSGTSEDRWECEVG
jgi:hypothetical protein